jgi:hypothetical protein
MNIASFDTFFWQTCSSLSWVCASDQKCDQNNQWLSNSLFCTTSELSDSMLATFQSWWSFILCLLWYLQQHSNYHQVAMHWVITYVQDYVASPQMDLWLLPCMVLWISDICWYIFYFLFSLFTSRKTQHNTYQNSYSEFILNFLNIIYSQITPFRKQLYLLQLKPLVFLTMLCLVITIVDMLTCQSVQESLTICFLIISHLYIIINRQTSRYLVGYLPVKSTKELLGN